MTAARILLALLLCAALLVSQATAASKPVQKKGAKPSPDARLAELTPEVRTGMANEKLATLRTLALNSRDHGIISINATGYEALIKRAPRNYHLFLEFTVLKPSRDCEPCKNLHSIVREVSGGLLRGLAAGEHKHDIFFVIIDFDHGGVSDIFTRADVKYTPLFAYIPPSDTTSLGDKPHRDDDVFDLRKYAMATEAVVQFVTMRTGVEIDTAVPLPLLQMLASVSAVVGLGWYLQDYINRIVPFQVVFFVGCIGVTTLCLGGLPYHYIRKTQWSSPGEAGLARMVANQQRHQYGLEAFFVGGINLAAAAAFLIVAVWVPSTDRFAMMPFRRRCGAFWEYLSVSALPVGLVAVCVFYFAAATLVNLNNVKMGGGYPFSMLNIASLWDWSHFGKFSSF